MEGEELLNNIDPLYLEPKCISYENTPNIIYSPHSSLPSAPPMNLLTLSGNDLLNEVNVLKSEVGVNNVKYIELGNEYYLEKYQYEFPTADIYILTKQNLLLMKLEKRLEIKQK